MTVPDAIDLAIRAQRARSNEAIAARDVDAVVALMVPDVTVAVAGGPVLAGQAASRAAFAEQFADTAFRGYVRETARVEVASASDGPPRAVERGRWTGRWQVRVFSQQVMRGTYTAEWVLEPLGWRIAKEVYLPDAG